jgi:hypothetical protein
MENKTALINCNPLFKDPSLSYELLSTEIEK